jgi:hypothetical protein
MISIDNNQDISCEKIQNIVCSPTFELSSTLSFYTALHKHTNRPKATAYFLIHNITYQIFMLHNNSNLLITIFFNA